jgi:arylsulfatase A-like enzyme
MSTIEAAQLTSRREFMQAGMATAGAALASSILPTATAQTSGKKPNLVFFYTEALRSDALSLAGHPILKTPNLDRIGHEGVWFKNAFCTNALCAPSRTAALTGMYSYAAGAVSNETTKGPLSSDIPLFTDLLHQAGYEVAIAGKVHVKNGVKERYWDYYFGFNAGSTDYDRPKFFEGRKGEVGPQTTYNQYADDLATDRALAWLDEKRDKPFCLLLWPQAPHGPFFRPRRHLDLYNGVAIPKPVTFDDDLKGYPGKPRAFANAANKVGNTNVAGDSVRSLEELVKNYYAGLVAVDDNIGRVLSWLEKSGELDNTAILLGSDHGYFLGEWRMFDKRFMHEPSIRVPILARYPERIKAGTVREEMVLDVDIAPTLLDLAGIKAPGNMQGHSLMPLVNGKAEGWRQDWLYENNDDGPEQVRPHRGIRTEQYKLIHYYLEPQEYELYDLKSDPGEQNNLYDNPAHATIQAQLWKRMAELRQENQPAQSVKAT